MPKLVDAQVGLEHVCLPGCDHGNALDGVELAQDYDLRDFESDIHLCSEACDHKDPIARVELATAVDMNDYASLDDSVHQTYSDHLDSEGKLGEIQGVIASVETGTTISAGLYTKHRDAASGVTASEALKPIENSQATPGTDSKVTFAKEPVVSELRVSISADIDGNSVSTSVNRGLVERTTQHVTVSAAPDTAGVGAFPGIERGLSQIPAAAPSQSISSRLKSLPELENQGVSTSFDPKRIQAAVGESSHQRTDFARTTSYEVLGTHERGPDRYRVVERDSRQATSGSRADEPTPTMRTAERISGSRPTTTGFSQGERFMGWATERPQRASESQISQSGRTSPREASPVPSKTKEAVERSRKESAVNSPRDFIDPTVRRRVELQAHREVASGAIRTEPPGLQAKAPSNLRSPSVAGSEIISQRSTTSELRNRGLGTSREGADRTVLVTDGASRKQSESPQRAMAVERSADSSLRSSRELAERVETPALVGRRVVDFSGKISARGSELREPGRVVDRRQGIETKRLVRGEAGHKEIDRALQKIEQRINERVRDISRRIEARLGRYISSTSKRSLLIQLDRLSLVNSILGILDEETERYEELASYPRTTRRRQSLRPARLRKHAKALRKKKKKLSEAENPSRNKTTQGVLTGVSGLHSTAAAGRLSSGLVGTHGGGPSRSLDIFQDKVDDDSESRRDAEV